MAAADTRLLLDGRLPRVSLSAQPPPPPPPKRQLASTMLPIRDSTAPASAARALSLSAPAVALMVELAAWLLTISTTDT